MPEKKKFKIRPKAQDWDSTFQLMSWWNPEKVRNARIMVVGAGALGNEVLKNLALMNVGHILIVDFDVIEYANLCRSVLFREKDLKKKNLKADIAAKRIREINPNVKVKVIHGDIGVDVGLGVFRRMDAIIGCLDNRLARLFINQLAFKVGVPWIDGAIQDLIGKASVYRPGVSCYECELADSERNRIREQLGCGDIAVRYDSQGRVPTTPVISSIIAGVQVQEALKLVHDNEAQSMAGKVFYYEGHSNTTLYFDNDPLNDFCESHFQYHDIISGPFGGKISLKSFFRWARKYFQTDNVHIELDHGLVLQISQDGIDRSFDVIIPKPHMSEDLLDQYRGKGGGEIHIDREILSIDTSFKRQDLSLKEIGIPPLHILTVIADGETHFVELTKDESFLTFK